jgi:hypothetical protein
MYLQQLITRDFINRNFSSAEEKKRLKRYRICFNKIEMPVIALKYLLLADAYLYYAHFKKDYWTCPNADQTQSPIKKILLRPAESAQGSPHNFLYSTMCQIELKEQFQENYEKWEREQLKRYTPLLK